MKIEGVIFDLDGTLVHTIEDIAGAANVLFSRHGRPEHGLDYYLKWIGNGAVKFIERAHGGSLEREQLLAYVAEFKEIYAGNLHDRSRVYEGVPDMLNELVNRGIKIAILSNKPHLLTKQVCKFYLSPWPLEPVFGQREKITPKPDPTAAFEIAELWGMAPEKILFVGDSDNDILTAQAAGMQPLGVGWGYGRLDRQPVEGMGALIDDPSKIITFID
jgi:phosphoglycolate phosphatase